MSKREWWVADCETDPFENGRTDIEPFIWGLFDGTTKHYFRTSQEFVNFISIREIIIFAHNGGKFDWVFLLEWANKEKIMLINGRISKMKIGLAELRDSVNILPIRLAQFRKTDFDYNLLYESVRENHMEKIISYLSDDLTDLYEIVGAFIEKYGVKLTLAGAAMSHWKTTYAPKGIKFKKGKVGKRFKDTYQPYYFGGRVECFKKGIIKENFKVFDINSAYPDAMCHNLPFGYGVDISKTIDESKIQMGFFDIEAESYGAFPKRDEKGGLSFPHARDSYTVSGFELLAAMETDTAKIIKVNKATYFRESINFEAYVKEFYTGKAYWKGKDEAQYLLCKLFLNSLYGKFAASPDKYDQSIIGEETDIKRMEGEGWKASPMECGLTLFSKPLPVEFQYYYNIATGAAITGFVRAKLWRQICEAESVLYCDTDSIAGTGTFQLGKEIGKWDIEAACDSAAIGGKKLYSFRLVDSKGKTKYKTASKGVRLTPAEIYSVAGGNTVEFTKLAPSMSIKGRRTLTRNVKMT